MNASQLAAGAERTDDTSVWIAASLFGGMARRAVVDHLVSIGYADEWAGAHVRAVEDSASYRAALPLIERKRKLESLLLTLGSLWSRSPDAAHVAERPSLDGSAFRELYAKNAPVVVRAGAAGWPAVQRWTPAFLQAEHGAAEVEYLAGRRDIDSPREVAEQSRRTTIADYVRDIVSRPASDAAYVVARNFSLFEPALSSLLDDVRPPDFVDLGSEWSKYARLWFGPRGTLTTLHHDLMPTIFVQVFGSKRFIMIHPAYTPVVPNPRGVYSDSDPLTWHHDPKLSLVPKYDFTVEPGDIVYIPPAWWHWVYATSASISVSFTGFEVDGVRDEWRAAGVCPLTVQRAPTAERRDAAQRA